MIDVKRYSSRRHQVPSTLPPPIRPYHVIGSSQSTVTSPLDCAAANNLYRSTAEMIGYDVIMGGHCWQNNTLANNQILRASSSSSQHHQRRSRSIAAPPCVYSNNERMRIPMTSRNTRRDVECSAGSTCAICQLPFRVLRDDKQLRRAVIETSVPCLPHDVMFGCNGEEVGTNTTSGPRWWSPTVPRSSSTSSDALLVGGSHFVLPTSPLRRCRSASDLLRLILVTSQTPRSFDDPSTTHVRSNRVHRDDNHHRNYCRNDVIVSTLTSLSNDIARSTRSLHQHLTEHDVTCIVPNN